MFIRFGYVGNELRTEMKLKLKNYLENSITYLKEVFVNKGSIFWIEGLIQTIIGILNTINYATTNNFNPDPLENLFAQNRSKSVMQSRHDSYLH